MGRRSLGESIRPHKTAILPTDSFLVGLAGDASCQKQRETAQRTFIVPVNRAKSCGGDKRLNGEQQERRGRGCSKWA